MPHSQGSTILNMVRMILFSIQGFYIRFSFRKKNVKTKMHHLVMSVSAPFSSLNVDIGQEDITAMDMLLIITNRYQLSDIFAGYARSLKWIIR
jgi:hypothetical protein